MGFGLWETAHKGDLLLMLAWIGIAVLVYALFLLWGAAVARISKRSLGRAVATSTLSVGAMFAVAFQAGPGAAAPLLAYVVGFLFDSLLVMPIFATSFKRAAAAVAVARASLVVAMLLWWLFSALVSAQGRGAAGVQLF
jgi:hypothetical protein